MTDKVQKIREWVKARLDENNSKQSIPQFYGMMEEDARFLDFLYTMQEEHVSDEQPSVILYGLTGSVGSPKEEPVSEDLEEAAYHNCIDRLSKESIEDFKAGAKWQEKQDQETIELAEDHAMLAGMNKMEEQMMAKAIDAHCFGFQQGAALFSFKLPADNYLVGSEVKVIVIKEE